MITTERRGHVFLIGLDRVAKRNAFDPPMFHALARALGELDRDDDLWCGLVFGHGDHFTGGIDLAQFAPLFERDDPFELEAGSVDPFGLRNHLSKPLVMAVHGITFTIGVEMLLAADIRIAASNARFAMLEVSRGLYPLGGATFRLVREAGWGNAMRYLLTGEEWDAAAALRLGLVQEVWSRAGNSIGHWRSRREFARRLRWVCGRRCGRRGWVWSTEKSRRRNTCATICEASWRVRISKKASRVFGSGGRRSFGGGSFLTG